MNAYEIEKNPRINGGVQKVVRERTHTELDTTTGEMIRVFTEQDAYVGREPDYVKVYTDCQLVFNNLDIALSPYIIAFAKYMTYANNEDSNYRCVIQTTKYIRDAVGELLNVSDRQVQRAIKTLVESEVFIPVTKNGVRQRAIYFVNPWVMAKGEWKDIKALRQEFEYVTGATSVCAIDDSGKRKVIVPLTQRADGQLEMNLGVEN